MTILHEYANKVWAYISPRKTQRTREKPFQFKVPAVPPKSCLKKRPQSPPHLLSPQLLSPPDRDLSPETRVNIWHTRTPSASSDVDITLVPMSPPESVLRSPEDHDGFEGDTLFNTSPISLSFDKGAALEVDANDDTIVVDDGGYFETHKGISFDERLLKQQRQRQELLGAGWPEDAVFLFQKINNRGYEPIMPIEWVDDLPSLPADLFTEVPDKPFIKPALGTHYHAQLALSSLLDLGAFVRDSIVTRAPRQPQYHVKRALAKYTHWAMKDGGVDAHWSTLPLFQTVTVSKDISSTVLESRTLAKLGSLHERWQSALAVDNSGSSSFATLDVPTLYGVSASHTIMAFVSYLPPSKENRVPGLRLIAMFDFGKEGFDVWNALAAAIFIIHCRNRMVQLQDYLPDPQVQDEEDPDV